MHKEGAQELNISTHHAAVQVPSAGCAALIVAQCPAVYPV